MIMKLCTYPGCNCLVSNGSRCPRHTAAKKGGFSGKRTKGREWHSLYYSAHWRQLRRDFLKKFPFCFVCGGRATIADHIVPHRGNPDLFYNEDNLQPMCQSCHSKKTLRENGFFSDRRQGEGG